MSYPHTCSHLYQQVQHHALLALLAAAGPPQTALGLDDDGEDAQQLGEAGAAAGEEALGHVLKVAGGKLEEGGLLNLQGREGA